MLVHRDVRAYQGFGGSLNAAIEDSNFLYGSGSFAQSIRESRRTFYFGRMLDKIRLHAKGELPSDYHQNLGKGFDEKCVKFLHVDYDGLIERIKRDGTDQEILNWCFAVGEKPTEDDIYVWNEFMRKRGWNDEVSEMVARRKAEAGMSDRSDIQTSFQFIDADEGHLPKAR